LPADELAAGDVEIGQGAGDEQAMGVLGQAAIAHLDEAEHTLDHADRVLDLGAHFGFGSVLGPLRLVDNSVPAVAAMGEIPRVRRSLMTWRWPR
jgi:hypothetical protein